MDGKGLCVLVGTAPGADEYFVEIVAIDDSNGVDEYQACFMAEPGAGGDNGADVGVVDVNSKACGDEDCFLIGLDTQRLLNTGHEVKARGFGSCVVQGRV